MTTPNSIPTEEDDPSISAAIDAISSRVETRFGSFDDIRPRNEDSAITLGTLNGIPSPTTEEESTSPRQFEANETRIYMVCSLPCHRPCAHLKCRAPHEFIVTLLLANSPAICRTINPPKPWRYSLTCFGKSLLSISNQA